MPDLSKFVARPIHLTATATLQSNSQQGVNAIALKNPSGEAMELLEIKWRLQIDYSSSLGAAIALGGAVACKLDLGNYPLTNGFVPVWSFGRGENVANESNYLYTPAAVADVVRDEYRWRLPRPLYVPAGAVVMATFQNLGLIQPAITLQVSYSARSVARSPKKVFLPYASCYASKPLNALAADSDQSSETDLGNPFDEPLHLQRFTGRVLTTASGYLVETGGAEYSAYLTRVRMSDSFGRPIIRSLIPFRNAFPAMSRSWELDGAVMDPRSYFNVYLSKNAPSETYTVPFTIQCFVGLVGHRAVNG